nr:hypothetical protein [Pseudodesulfovibrio indicus]
MKTADSHIRRDFAPQARHQPEREKHEIENPDDGRKNHSGRGQLNGSMLDLVKNDPQGKAQSRDDESDGDCGEQTAVQMMEAEAKRLIDFSSLCFYFSFLPQIDKGDDRGEAKEEIAQRAGNDVEEQGERQCGYCFVEWF